MKLFVFPAVTLIAVATLFTFESSSSKELLTNHNHAIAHRPTTMDTIPDNFPYQKTEAEWREILTPAQFRILRKKGTEFPYVNEYHDSNKDGIYVCAGCGQILYDSRNKYKSGTGWPSFWKPISDSLVVELEDNSLFMTRTEIVCSNCGGHLGHVFDDGPDPSGLRYCMNSAALKLVDRDKAHQQLKKD